MGTLYLIVNLSLLCATHGNRHFDALCGAESVVVEYLPDGGTECLEADATVFAVILYVAHLCWLFDAGVGHKSVAFAYTEHEHTSCVALVGAVLDVREQRSREGNGVVGRVGNDVVP